MYRTISQFILSKLPVRFSLNLWVPDKETGSGHLLYRHCKVQMYFWGYQFTQSLLTHTGRYSSNFCCSVLSWYFSYWKLSHKIFFYFYLIILFQTYLFVGNAKWERYQPTWRGEENRETMKTYAFTMSVVFNKSISFSEVFLILKFSFLFCSGVFLFPSMVKIFISF